MPNLNTPTPVSESTLEARVVSDLLGQLQQLRESAPDWYAYFEDVDADICSREQLLDLINSAPNDAAKFFLLGKYTMRLAIASITGREFC